MPAPKKWFLLSAAVAVAGMAALAQNQKSPILNSTGIEWNSLEPKPNATGSSRKFFEGPTASLDLLECHASTLNPGATNHVILKRPNDEIIIVKEGAIEAYVGDQWVHLGPGSVIFNAANAPQSMRNAGTVPATYHVITFRTTAVKPPVSEKQN
jgi:mannose-6-phosphate isomerase-like protein (cupin superfamily)